MKDMSGHIRALVVEPGMEPVETDIQNTLEALQALVGGYIECVSFALPDGTEFVAVCDEEGRLTGKPYNCRVNGVSFVGTVVLLGVDGEEFADVPPAARGYIQ